MPRDGREDPRGAAWGARGGRFVETTDSAGSTGAAVTRMRRGNKQATAARPAQEQPAQPDRVGRDWNQREFTQGIQTGVQQLVEFVSQVGACSAPSPVRAGARLTRMRPFRARADNSTRVRLAQLNGRIARIERRVELVEATLNSVDQEES